MKHLEIRGVMLDMGRLMERHEYYFDLAPRLAQWGYNTIVAHFTDDDGCAMCFDSRPELATRYAMTNEQWQRFIDHCLSHGLTLIPELETFGHTAFIHDHKRYAHLRIPTHGQFNAMNVAHPDAKDLLRDLVADTARMFPGPFIHAGLDEVNFNITGTRPPELAGKEDWEIFADHVKYMHKLIAAEGKRMMIWGDHVVLDERIARAIPKDIVIYDWHYYANVRPASVRLLTQYGFDVVCSPASCRFGEMVLPTNITQTNLQRFSRIAHAGGPKVVGLVNAAWTPFRFLAGIEQFALALGGAWFENPEADSVKIVTRFFSTQYGLTRASAAADALLELSALIPNREPNSGPRRNMTPSHGFLRMLGTEPVGPDYQTIPLTDVERRQATRIAQDASRCRQTLARFTKKVRRNADEFSAYLLAADILIWAASIGINDSPKAKPASRKALIKTGRALLKRVLADWDRYRYSDDPKRNHPGHHNTDGLIDNITRAIARLEGKTAGGRAKQSASAFVP